MGEVTHLQDGKRRCHVCGKPAVMKYRPFCSKRCADIDLGRWLKESYRMETEEESDFDEEIDPGQA